MRRNLLEPLRGKSLAEWANVRRDPWAQRQQPRRHRERDLRRQAAELCDALSSEGFSCPRIAKQIGLAPRTLCDWHCRWRRDALDPRLKL